MCFVNDICFVFSSFFLVIVLKTLKFMSSVLFGTHILPDVLSRVLQLPSHVSKLIANS